MLYFNDRSTPGKTEGWTRKEIKSKNTMWLSHEQYLCSHNNENWFNQKVWYDYTGQKKKKGKSASACVFMCYGSMA